jgi:hypothetical protein
MHIEYTKKNPNQGASLHEDKTIQTGSKLQMSPLFSSLICHLPEVSAASFIELLSLPAIRDTKSAANPDAGRDRSAGIRFIR